MPLCKWDWEDAHGVVMQSTAFLLQGAPQVKLWWERAGGGVLWLEGVLLPWHLSPLSSQGTKILHSEGSLHLLTSAWSKEHYWDKYLNGREMSVSGGKMEGRETNLIQMIAQEQMGNKLSLNECGWKWEKGFQQELWNSLWVRIDVKKKKKNSSF